MQRLFSKQRGTLTVRENWPSECRRFLAGCKISRDYPFKIQRKGGSIVGWIGLVPAGPAECKSCSLRSVISHVTVPLRLKGKWAYNWVDGIDTCWATECRSFLAGYKISPDCPFKAERKGGV
jgi:hypothetical protein